MESRQWEAPNIILQEVLEEIRDNAHYLEADILKLLQHIRYVAERGSKKDVAQLGHSIIKRKLRRKTKHHVIKRLKAYSAIKELDEDLLRSDVLKRKEFRKTAHFIDLGSRGESYLNLNYDDLAAKDKSKINLYLDKVPLQTVVKDEEKVLHEELVDLYMKLQAERLTYREKFKKPETLVQAITLADNMVDLMDATEKMQRDEERGFSMPSQSEEWIVQSEEKEEFKKSLSADEVSEKGSIPSPKEYSVGSLATSDDAKETSFFSDDEDASMSTADEEMAETEITQEEMRALIQKLKRSLENTKLANLTRENDFTPELILRLLFHSKSELKVIELENDCLELFLIKNAPHLLLHSDINGPKHHQITRKGRLIVKLLYKNKLLKSSLNVKHSKHKKKPKWFNQDDISLSTDSTDVSSVDYTFPFIEKKKIMVIQATEDLRSLCDILTTKMNDKFIKETGERHELFSHYIDISKQEKLFKLASGKNSANFPQVMYLFWKRWLLSNLQDLIFMETRGRLICKSVSSMLRLKRHFDYLESITQYGDKLYAQVFYDSVAEEYTLLAEGVYDLRKGIADLLNDIFFSYHKIDNKIEEFNHIKKDFDNIQSQIKSCNRIRRREKEKYNKIKYVLDTTGNEHKKSSIYRLNDQESPNLRVYIKYKMRNNFTCHTLNKLHGLVKNQEIKVKSLTDVNSVYDKYDRIKNKKLKGFESLLAVVKRKFQSPSEPSLKQVVSKKIKKKQKDKIKKTRK